MNTYKWHNQTFRAWSKMACNRVNGNANARVLAEDHQPHSWSGEFILYGPYFCEGRNPVEPYKPKHRADA